MNHFSEVSIVTPSALYVQQMEALNAPVKRHERVIRADIASGELDPDMRAFGRYIARSQKKGRSVRIPAMSGSDWGHVLRTLELKRACN